MNNNLVGLKKLKDELRSVSLLSFFMGKKNKAEFKRLKAQLEETERIIDDFISLFSDDGWCAYDSMNLPMIKEAVREAKDKGKEAGEQVLISYYMNDVKNVVHLLRYKATPFADRYELLSKAFEDHFARRFHASVPLFLIIADGVVNDSTKNMGFFAEGTEVSAWDCLVGCNESLAKMKDLFNKSRKKTNKDRILVPYRNGILHGRDLNYANEYVSCKCVALLFAIADWIQMKESETKRKEQFEKNSSTPSLGECIRTYKRIKEDKEKLDAWERKEVIVGKNIPENPSKKDCIAYPYVEPLIDAMDAWQGKNYGKLSDCFKNLFDRNISPKKRAGLCREMFENKELISYRLLEVDERGSSLSALTIVVRWRSNNEIHEEKLQFGSVYLDKAGKTAFIWNEGEWVLNPWNVSGLYRD